MGGRGGDFFFFLFREIVSNIRVVAASAVCCL